MILLFIFLQTGREHTDFTCVIMSVLACDDVVLNILQPAVCTAGR